MRFPTIRRSSATGDSSQVLLGAVRRNRATFFLASIACLVIVFGELPLWLSLTSPPVEVELGYTQGSVVSGAVFQGRPFRLYTGKRVFTQGWEKRIGRSPIKAEKNLLGVLPKGIRLSSNITCTKWSVVTTIFEPSEAIQDAANFGHDWCIVIVGDYKTPKDFIDGNGKLRDNDSVFYFDMAEQKVWGKLPGEVGAFVTALPYNHFARKNFGFLFAILHGAKFIYDFDDDNYVKKGVNGRPRNLIPNETEVADVRHVEVESNAFNHHQLMAATIESSWARGFPLERILDEKTRGTVVSTSNLSFEKVGVVQFVADGNPDIDAVHRMTKPLPMDFADESKSSPLLVPPNAASPYNAQATVHHWPAFFATLLPITVKSRVSDIWRAYYAAPLFRDIGVSILFAPPKIHQIRTAHSYIGDMKAEGDLYFKSDKLIDFLHNWESAEKSIPSRMEQLWIDLYERGYHEEDDVELVQKWLSALVQIQYKFKKPHQTQ